MSKRFRWGYIAPRLTLLLALALFVQFCAGPLARKALIQTGEKALGAKVDIAAIDVDLLGTNLVARHVVLANPNRPFHNLAEIEQLSVDVSLPALLRKHVVVDSAQAKGLKFDTPRDDDGRLAPPAEEEIQPGVLGKLQQQALGSAQNWLDGYLEDLEDLAEADARGKFRSVPLAEELAQRWPDEYRQLEEKIRDVRRRIARIKQIYSEGRQNPLRHLAQLQTLPAEIQQVQADVSSIQARLNGWNAQLESDQHAIAAAKAHDEALLREYLDVGSLDPQQLTDYLLQERLAGPVSTAIHWVQTMRKLVPSKPQADGDGRIRGTDVIFAGLELPPSFLVKSLHIEGGGRQGGEDYTIAGNVLGLSSHPKRYGRPVLAKLAARGAIVAEIEGEFDRTGEVPVDVLRIHCPAIAISDNRIGSRKNIAIRMPRGDASLEGVIKVQEEALSATVRLSSTNVRFEADVAEKAGGERTAHVLREALSSVDRFDAKILVTGTLDSPQYKIESPVGALLAKGIQGALQSEVTRQQQKLAQQLDAKINAEWGRVQQQVSAERDKLIGQLTTEHGELLALAQQTTQILGVSPTDLGRAAERIGLGSPFKKPPRR